MWNNAYPEGKVNLVKDLNEQQREAVVNTEGPALTLAGPGSGKTRVLAYRVAYLIENLNISPNRILAVTFTNKAAREMKNRIHSLLPGLPSSPHLSTFHSFCLRILRETAGKGLSTVKRNFVVYDDDDSRKLIKSILKEIDKDDLLRPGVISARIGIAKNNIESPEIFTDHADTYLDEVIGEVYHAYQTTLEKSGGLDFDDLIMKTALTFQTFPALLARYRSYFKYIHVDEFQDTNLSQYEIVKMLSAEHKNIFVVGDEDQSIYSWRGANLDNIHLFKSEFPDYALYKLEKNYRSTGNIVRLSSQLISGNEDREEKYHVTDNPEGESVVYFSAGSDFEEASYVISSIRRLSGIYNLNNIAVLYRTNWQSRLFEEELVKSRIPYVIIGGMKFYQRKEIKDIISYLRFIVNPDDNAALERIINTPKRGIGAKTMDKIKAEAKQNGVSIGSLLSTRLETLPLAASTIRKIELFYSLICSLRKLASTQPASQVIKAIITKTGYHTSLAEDKSPVSDNRLDNLNELVSAAASFADENPEADINSYLDHASLLTDLDEYNPNQQITMMTIHSAKGLEFDVVFLVGLEENLLPHSRSLDDVRQVEEERRLCFVAMTRAAKMLYLTNARQRMMGEGMMRNKESRFLSSIDWSMLNTASRMQTGLDPQPGVKKTSTLKVGSNLDNIKSFFKDRNIELTPLDDSPGKATNDELKYGTKVRHRKFGDGIVYSVDGQGKGRKAKIMFAAAGYKTLLLEYADLKILS